jgi:type VI secretion system protein VasJ
MDESLEKDIQISENLADLLAPISKESPTGGTASGEEAYFKLDMEIGKAVPDYNVCINLSSDILKEKSKDLRVASWMCFALYRHESMKGLKDGITLILELLKNYSDKLFPENPLHRSKALQFLNSSRFVKLLERENINREIAPYIIEIEDLFKQLIIESEKQFPHNIPDLKNLSLAITNHAETAKKIAVKETKKPVSVEVKEEKKIEIKGEPKEEPKEEGPTSEEAADKPPADEAKPIGEFSISSEKDAILAIKKALRFFAQSEDEHISKNEPFIYGLSRTLMWNRLTIPPHTDFVTQIAPPDVSIQNTYQEWFANQEWDKLIKTTELNFLNDDTRFKYWITAQRYQCHAFVQKGGGAKFIADEIKFHLAKLIKRFPDFPRLKFENDMAFADKETLNWIENDVKTSLGSQKIEEVLLPPILGEDYDPINQAFQRACEELPDRFEKNLEKMQHGLSGETRRKGRFLRLLNLANFCIQARQYKLAKVHLSSLLTKIEDYQLAEWEPGLCTAVWESTYLVNQKLLESEQDREEKSHLEKQQSNLFTKIGNYDGVRALRLTNRQIKKGD